MHCSLTSPNSISKMLANYVMVGEVLFSLGYSALFNIPRYPEGNPIANNCKGRNEVYFEFDYFVEGGISRGGGQYCMIENPFGKYACYTSIGIAIIVCSNLCEIFFLGRIVMYMKTQTESVKKYLTNSVFEDRKR